ncbi:unnamed protein product [Cyclocybe aegerita]|uniref:Fanconi-associated nuclease n=1 Tax=Cyclocybe aegerita TaxID=1973307 RepID=A0A8S0W553_CYCAE|nr:unnamed protein product [Cyclocybe aegerita]
MSTPKKQQQQLIFGGNSPTVLRLIKNQEAVEEEVDGLDERRETKGGSQKPSAYVEVFETMMRTVLGHEPELLSEQEIMALSMYGKLCYNTRYCLTRLVLRKPYQWHPISALEGYKREVGEDGLASSIRDLCQPINSLLNDGMTVKEEPVDSVKSESMDTDVSIKKEEGPPVIDLTLDADDEEVKPNIPCTAAPTLEKHTSTLAGPSRLRPPRPHEDDPIKGVLEADVDSMHLDAFCEDESTMTLHEILWRLTKDQLKELVKTTRTKVEPTAKKCDIIYALEDTALKQTILELEFVAPPATKRKGKGKAKDDGFKQTRLSFKKKSDVDKPPVTQEQRLREMAIERLGKCVRVNFDFHRLVRRLDIICYRQPEHPTSLMLPALLSVFKKRNFTMYKPTRCSDIWSTRQEFLEYEMALELEMHLEEIIDPPPDPYAKKSPKTPAPRKSEFITPGPRASRSCTTPLKTPGTIVNNQALEQLTVKLEDEAVQLEAAPVEEVETPVVEATKEEKVIDHLEKWILPRWTIYVSKECEREARIRPPGLERFDAGHVFTRMLYKATKVLGPSKKYELELKIIESLLSQRHWHRGRRGSWYERRAVVIGHLIRGTKDAQEKEELRRRTLEGVKEALRDDDTHIVHRPSLFRRVEKLENALKIAKSERSTCEGDLRKPPIVILEAFKIPPLQLDALGRPLEKENTPGAPLLAYIPVTKVGKLPEEPKQKRKTGKSRWKGRNNQIVDVETRALEFYEDKGYRGFHAETRILTTLFGLLFWDIIFTEVPGAFDTPYQYAPLDIWSDSFYLARKALIDQRLEVIRQGGGRDILHEHDDLYRERQFICAGVTWDICKRDDLLDIVDCLGGESLAFICQLFCEDYKGRSSGAPDLFVWNIKERDCKFVEVKGPGDTPQENQKLWFDSLCRAGAAVEICKVVDINAPPPKGKKRKAKTPGSARGGNTAPPEEEEDGCCDEEPDYEQLDVEPELDADCPELETSSKIKRRRISHPEDASPSVPRVNRAEIVLSPSKYRVA